jgi:epoxyqueuosine reductase
VLRKTHDRFEDLVQWLSSTSVANPPLVRGSMRFIPPLPAFLRRSLQPVRGPWPDVAISVPEPLRGEARNRTDPALQEAAIRDDPLRTFGKKFPLATAWTTSLIWRVRLPMLPRWLRATHGARRTGRWRPSTPVAAAQVDPTQLTRDLRKRAAELGINVVGISAYDQRYSAATFDPAVSGDRIIVCILEQPFQATQEIPSVHAELGALTTYTAAVSLAVKLADFLHEQGFVAEAHDNSGPHLVIPYAVEAGLGQLGLNGQLLTPVAGSRCRVVTISTAAPLDVDEPVDYGVKALCDACHACVDRCPSGAIPKMRKMHRGVEKAKINTKRCLPVVAKAEGCGVCMKVCPVQRYGLEPVLAEYARSGQVLGRGTRELEEYIWPLTGEVIGVGSKPRLDRDFFFIPGGEPL